MGRRLQVLLQRCLCSGGVSTEVLLVGRRLQVLLQRCLYSGGASTEVLLVGRRLQVLSLEVLLERRSLYSGGASSGPAPPSAAPQHPHWYFAACSAA